MDTSHKEVCAMITLCPHCGTLNRVPEDKLHNNPTCGKCKKPLFTGEPVEMNTELFVKALQKSDQPLVVDFWASWCGPCKMFAPTFARVASQFEPRARFVKINTETNPQLATQFGIRSIPTIAIFKNGQMVDQIAGALPPQQFAQWVAQHV